MVTTKNDIDKAIRTSQEEACEFITNFLVKNSKEHLDAKEVKAAVMSSLNMDNVLGMRFNSAFDSLFDYMQRHCAPVEIDDVKENWLHVLDKFTEASPKREPSSEEDIFLPLQDEIGFSQKTYAQFFDAGRDLYEQKLFKQAADVFFLLSFINHSYYNVWLMLGLSEQKCGNFDSALKAYAMATITNIDTPESFLRAADCCLEMGDQNEAKLYVEEALPRIEKNPEYATFSAYAAELKSLCKK